jgi:hypothetical protein
MPRRNRVTVTKNPPTIGRPLFMLTAETLAGGCPHHQKRSGKVSATSVSALTKEADFRDGLVE